MNEVDTRIVEMQFNNKNFEQNVATSLNTLDKLKQALNFDKQAKGLESLQGVTARIDFSPFAGALDSVQQRFSMLGVVGASVINNLTTGVMSAAKNILTAIPRQISEGGMSRALNLEQARFTLEGLLGKYEDGAKRIEEMMTAASNAVSGTAYGLDEAARVTSQLVASGVNDAEKMETILKGIAGGAAMTGRSFSDIGNIFTTVASNGRLMTMQLRQFSASGLNVSSVLAEQLGKTEQQINEMVSKGKIDFETFSSAMSNAFGEQAAKANDTYAGSLANVKSALSRIGEVLKTNRINNLKNLFNAIRPQINAIKTELMTTLTFINKISNAVTKKLIKAIEGIKIEGKLKNWNALLEKINVTKKINKAYKTITKVINTLWPSLKALFKTTGYLLKQVKFIFEDVFYVVSEGLKKTFYFAKKPLKLVQYFIEYTNTALHILADALNDLVVYFLESGNVNKFINFFKGVGVVLQELWLIFSGVFGHAVALFRKIFHIGSEATPFTKLLDFIANSFGKIGDMLMKLDGISAKIDGFLYNLIESSKPVAEFLGIVFNRIKEIFKSIGDAIKSAAGFVSDSVGGIEISLEGLKSVLDKIKGVISSILSYVGETFAEFWENLSAPFKNNNSNFLLSFLGAFELMLTTIFSARTISAMKTADITFGSFRDLLKKLPDSIKKFVNAPFEKIFSVMDQFKETLKTWQNSLKADTIKKIAEAIALIAASMFILSTIDADKLEQSVGAVGAIIIALTGAMYAFSSMKLPDIKRLGGVMATLVGLGIATVLLSAAAKNLSSVNWEDLKRGLSGVGIILGELAAFMAASKVFGNGAKGMLTLSAGIYIISKAMENLAAIDADGLGRALQTVGALLGIFAIFTNIVKPKGILRTATAFAIIGGSLSIFSKAIEKLGNIPIKKIKKGLMAMAGALGAVAVATRIMSKSGNILKGASIFIVAKALLILADALKKIGGIPMDKLKNGLQGLALGLTAIVAALIFAKGSLGGALAIIVAAEAVKILVSALKIFSEMDPKTLAISLLGLAGALGILIGAGALAGMVAGGLLALGAAVILIGAGTLAAGAGVFLLASGLSLLIASASVGIPVIMTFLTNLIATIPLFMQQLGVGLIALLDTLSNGYDAFVKFGVTILTATIDGILQTLPKLVELLGVLITTFSTIILEHLPTIIDTGIQMLYALVDGIIDAMPVLVDKAFVLIVTFIDSMAAAIEEHGGELKDAFVRLLISILDFLGMEGKKFFEKGKELMIKVKDGIVKVKDNVIEGVRSIIESAKQKILDFKDKFLEAGKFIMNGLKEGLKKVPVVGTVISIGESIKNAFTKNQKIESPSKVWKQYGIFIDEGLAQGLLKGLGGVHKALKKIISAFEIDNVLVSFTKYTNDAIKKQTDNLVNNSIRSITWGKSVADKLMGNYKGMSARTKSMAITEKLYKAVTKSVAALSKNLYINSQAYKEAKQNVKLYNKAIAKEQETLAKNKKKIKELQEERKKASKKRREEIDKEIKDLKQSNKEVYANIKDLNKGLKSELKGISEGAKNAYKEYRQSIRESIMGNANILQTSVQDYVNLFERMSDVEEVSVDELLFNMQSQIKGISQWREDLDKLAKRGIADGLLDKLEAMGPDGAKYVQAFLKMTKDELSKANMMFKAEGELTSQVLLDNMRSDLNAVKDWSNNIKKLADIGIRYDILKDLVDQGPDNAEYVQALANMTEAEIAQVNALYTKQGKLPSQIADTVLGALAEALSKEDADRLASATAKSTSAIAEVLSYEFKDITNEIEGSGEAIATALTVGIKAGQPGILEASQIIGDTALNEFRTYFSTENGTLIAVQITNGLVSGIETGGTAVSEAARELARQAYESITDELDINSPSKRMEEVGKFSDLGLANGLIKYASVVMNSATKLGGSTFEAIRESLSKVYDYMDSSISNPVITPVLDLSEVDKKAKHINDLFESNKVIVGADGKSGEIQNGMNFNFTQNNYSPKPLPRIEIYRQTRNMISSVKGMVG